MGHLTRAVLEILWFSSSRGRPPPQRRLLPCGHRVGSAFTGTPYAGLGLSGSGRDYRLGWRLGTARATSGFSLNLEGTRSETADAGAAKHGVMLTGEMRW